MIFAFIVILTLPFWMFRLISFFFWTLLFVPSGALIWLAIAVLAGYIVWATVSLARDLIRSAKEQRALTLLAREGDEGAGKTLLELRLKRPPIWKAATGVVAMKLLVAPALAISLWHSFIGSPAPARVDGKWRSETPRQGVEQLLRAMDQMIDEPPSAKQ